MTRPPALVCGVLIIGVLSGIALLLSFAAMSTSAFAHDLSGDWSRNDRTGPASIHITQTGEKFRATETWSVEQNVYTTSYFATLQPSNGEHGGSQDRWKVCLGHLIGMVRVCWWGSVADDGRRLDLENIPVGPF